MEFSLTYKSALTK
ncbi:Protein of unknown function [Lactobacillus delbrueckii subsp. lactis]|nr:Putative uncharacterized protein [Lactobacillus delbrueckii subsp. lactis]CDR80294.1 Protein of unknown function [Lactobacillus delbrueckii subsp. lactis]CDR82549.1 Protein of unknown function [Lactobacillus delbrueckii subsp. lactis]CDR84622.1 Protein of unknown function [Lactobacillus delbrueckii subsp. lactis]